METFRTYTELDRYGRLHVISSTQIVFHVRRILSHALGIPKSRIRVEKPRIGGGFGAKQTAVCEVYPAFVTMKTGRPAMCVFTRKEAQTCGSPRHEMEIKVRLGANDDGRIRALDVTTLSNSGAYGEHGWATVGLTGHKSIPLYTGSLEAFKFTADVVYTNMQPSGAYRGFGATQGQFAVETAVNELAEMLRRDPIGLREQNMLREGMIMPAYFNEVANACALDRCLDRCRQMFDWEAKYPVRDMGNGKVRAAGVGMSMQGSGIAGIDSGSVTVRLNDDGTYMLVIGAADMGTGCDTILAQMVAEHMECSVDDVSVFGADTDASPYDSGSYASSTTYVTGMAVEKACAQLKERLCAIAAEVLGCAADELAFEGGCVVRESTGETVSLPAIAEKSQCNSCQLAEATAMHSPRCPRRLSWWAWRKSSSIARPAQSRCSTLTPWSTAAFPSTRHSRASRSRAASCRASGTRSWRTSPARPRALSASRACSPTVCPRAWMWGRSTWSSSIPMSPRVRSARSRLARSSSIRRLLR